jgi:predicted SAM-dependent methyltransferase
VLKFNLGCGDKCAQGWVNLDASWNLFLSRFPVLRGFCKALSGGKSPAGPANVGYWDARKPLPCKDGAADVIYASHLLEHLSRPKALALLKECRRALKPGGICRMVVPDLKGAAEQYLAKKISADGFMEFLNFKERHLRSEPAPKKNLLLDARRPAPP